MNCEIVDFCSSVAILAVFPWKPVVSVWFGIALAGGMASLGMKQEKEGMVACGGIIFLTTIIQLICWLAIGPYSLRWLVGPFIAIGIFFILTGTEEGRAQAGVTLIMYSLIFWGIASAVRTGETKLVDVAVAKALEEAEKKVGVRTKEKWKREFDKIWPREVKKAPEGFLITQDDIPVRALARRPLAPLYSGRETTPDKVVGPMDPWTPYYVFERADNALLIGETENTKPKDRTWVRGWDCFCWTTRECLNIEQPIQIFASLEDAKAGRKPIQYQYTFTEHFISRDQTQKAAAFLIPSLPVLHRVDAKYWCFVRPEGSATNPDQEGGYGAYWLVWDGVNPSVSCRIRTTRRELETFLGNLQTLLLEYEEVPDKRDGAKWEMYNRGVQNFTWRELHKLSRTQIRNGLEGIPLRAGFMEQRIESELQAQKIKNRIVALSRWSNSELWTAEDVSFVDAEMIP